MTDLANLVLAVDSSQVKAGTASLDGLTAAGARAEAATLGLGKGSRTAAADAAAMAMAAQASSRAAMGMATGFKASSDALRVNTIAMRETLVVARELSRGNFTRLPGSLTLLAQGISAQGGGLGGFASSLMKTLGLIKTVQNAELAEEATNAAAAAEAVEGAARRAAANVTAADTELALAEAQLRVTAGTSAEAAAQARLAEAHMAVGAAAGEAAVAENALAAAYAASAEAGAASTATATTAVTGLGAALGLAAIGGGLAAAAFMEVKDAAEQTDPSAQHLISTLGLTGAEVKKLKDTTVTWGDIAKGTFDVVAQHAGTSASQVSSFFHEAFLETAQVGVSAAQVILASFAAMVKGVHDSLTSLPMLAIPGGIPFALQGLHNAGSAALDQFKKTYGDVGKFFHQELPAAANARRDQRVTQQAEQIIAGRKPAREREPRAPRSANDNANKAIADQKAYEDMVARLDEQILAAKQKLAGTAEEQAQLAIQQIAVEQSKTIADAKAMLAQGKITSGEEQHLELQARELADLKKQAVLREEQTKLLTQQQAAQDQLFGFQTDALKFADQMATTQAGHRKVQLDMLDIAYQQKAYDLEILRAKQQLAGDYAAVALTQGQLDNLPTQQAQQHALVIKGTMNPLQQWEDQFKPDQIIESLQRIEVQGLDGLAAAIGGVVAGTENLKTAFGDLARSVISDIVQMTVKMLIFRAISSIFGGGNVPSPDLAAPASLSPDMLNPQVLPHLAGGGLMSVGGLGGVDTNLLSINGQPRAMVSGDETLAIIPRSRSAPANNNAPHKVVVEVRIDDSVLNARIVQGAGQVVLAAAPSIAKGAVSGMARSQSRPKLMGTR